MLFVFDNGDTIDSLVFIIGSEEFNRMKSYEGVLTFFVLL